MSSSRRRPPAGQALLPLAGAVPPAALLEARHYLGATPRGTLTWADELGVLVFAPPASRRLPRSSWLELSRWCLTGGPNAGSRQWAAAWRWLREHHPACTTVVSYSDPGHGHTGALYRACGWLWAPTWHRLRPPPSGNGSWSSSEAAKAAGVKDRWVFPLRPDPERQALLSVQDAAVRARMPWAEYREPRFRRGVPVVGSGGGDYKRWRAGQPEGPR